MKYGSGGDRFNFPTLDSRGRKPALAGVVLQPLLQLDSSLHYERRLFLKGGLVDADSKMSSW